MPIPRRKPEPMLMPDLEMGYANQEEAMPALSGPAAYQTGTCFCAGPIVCIQVVHAGCEDVNAPVEDLDVHSNNINAASVSSVGRSKSTKQTLSNGGSNNEAGLPP